MVKVQKPQPKSLNKSNSIEGVSKKKNKPEKATKLPAAAALEEANNKKGKNAALKKADGAVKAKKGTAQAEDRKETAKRRGKEAFDPGASRIPGRSSCRKQKVQSEAGEGSQEAFDFGTPRVSSSPKERNQG